MQQESIKKDIWKAMGMCLEWNAMGMKLKAIETNWNAIKKKLQCDWNAIRT